MAGRTKKLVKIAYWDTEQPGATPGLIGQVRHPIQCIDSSTRLATVVDAMPSVHRVSGECRAVRGEGIDVRVNTARTYEALLRQAGVVVGTRARICTHAHTHAHVHTHA